MAVKLTDLVGPHLVEAWWSGTRAKYHHPVCTSLCEDPTKWGTYCVILNGQRRDGDHLNVTLLRMDGVTYKFEEEAISTSDPADRSTMLGPIAAMALKDWQWDFQFDAPAGGPRMVEVRLFGNVDEILYGTSEITGRCLFHIGTMTRTSRSWAERMDHVSKCDPLEYDVPWLEPIDPNPPVEIRAKPSRMISTPKKTPAGRNGQGKIGSVAAESVRPSAEKRRLQKAAQLAQWRRERGE